MTSRHRLEFAPGWLARRIRTAVIVLLVLGVCGFLIDGANRPANPYLAKNQSLSVPTVAGASSVIPRSSAVNYGTAKLLISSSQGLSAPLDPPCALVASSSAAQQRGLMYRTTVAPFAGMVFVFDHPVEVSFYMKNTPMPLSIAWFDAAGAYIGSATMPTCTQVCPTYTSVRPFELALEVPSGRLASMGIGAGSSLHLGSPC